MSNQTTHVSHLALLNKIVSGGKKKITVLLHVHCGPHGFLVG